MPERKNISGVRSKRKRIPSLDPAKAREIAALFDMTDGDYDYVAERTRVQRADVLAVALADIRRRGPGHAGSTVRPFIVRTA